MKKILLGTANEGKLREYQELLTELDIKIILPKDININEEPEENSTSFKENAKTKARFYCEKSGLITISDDGGLEIDALGGEPGVKSRRWPGYKAKDRELIDLALKKLENIPTNKRSARFFVVVAVAAPDGRIETFEGSLEGIITSKIHKPIIPGYPFRSIFYSSKIGKVLSESLPGESKNLHRKEALLKASYFIDSL